MTIPYISRKLRGYFWGEAAWQVLNPAQKRCRSHQHFQFLIAILELLQNKNLVLINQVHGWTKVNLNLPFRHKDKKFRYQEKFYLTAVVVWARELGRIECQNTENLRSLQNTNKKDIQNQCLCYPMWRKFDVTSTTKFLKYFLLRNQTWNRVLQGWGAGEMIGAQTYNKARVQNSTYN